MGMFDTININRKWLPESLKKEEHGWQTKDLENLLLNYKIDKEGTLSILEESSSWIEKPLELPKYDSYSGNITVCNFVGEGNYDKFVQLSINFEKGKLIKLQEINELL